MRQLINAALTHTRTTLLLLVGLLLAGTAAWQAIPKEANPDVTIPIIYVSLALEGVSPEDGERLLVRPMEQELRGIEGLRKFTAQSSEGHGSVTLEFDPGFDPDTALADVRERISWRVSGESNPEAVTRIRSVYATLGFVTLGGGDNLGIVKNSTLEVVRDEEVIAKLKVTTVESKSAAADIIPDSGVDGESVQVGDTVRAAQKAAPEPDPAAAPVPSPDPLDADPLGDPAPEPEPKPDEADPFG